MKIKTLLILSMCVAAFAVSAQSTIFIETFDNENSWHPVLNAATNGTLTANNNAAIADYKVVNDNFYFAEDNCALIESNWGAQTYKTAYSSSRVLNLAANPGAEIEYTGLRFRFTTKDFVRAHLTLSIGQFWGTDRKSVV